MARNILSANPLRRLRENANLTVEQVAALSKVSSKAVYIAECGAYEQPLEALVHFYLNRVDDLDLLQLDEDYAAFRKKLRAITKNSIPESAWDFEIPLAEVGMVPTKFGTYLSPISDFRLNKLNWTSTELINKILVNPGTLFKLESGQFYRVPDTISAALRECGATKTFLGELHERTAVFHDRRKQDTRRASKFRASQRR